MSFFLAQNKYISLFFSDQSRRSLSVVSVHSQPSFRAICSAQSQGSLKAVSGWSQRNLSVVSGQSQGSLRAVSAQSQRSLSAVSLQSQHILSIFSAHLLFGVVYIFYTCPVKETFDRNILPKKESKICGLTKLMYVTCTAWSIFALRSKVRCENRVYSKLHTQVQQHLIFHTATFCVWFLDGTEHNWRKLFVKEHCRKILLIL